jgi:hypothetical protein
VLQVGVAPLPGSTRIYLRAEQRVVDCTSELCPYATPYIVKNSTMETNVRSSIMVAAILWLSQLITGSRRILPCVAANADRFPAEPLSQNCR